MTYERLEGTLDSVYVFLASLRICIYHNEICEIHEKKEIVEIEINSMQNQNN